MQQTEVIAMLQDLLQKLHANTLDRNEYVILLNTYCKLQLLRRGEEMEDVDPVDCLALGAFIQTQIRMDAQSSNT